MDEEPTENDVALRGRVSAEPELRVLPSGDEVWTFRLVVRRQHSSPMTRGSRQVSDWVDCAAWGGRARLTVSAWHAGDEVELRGALRRRFFRTATGTASRVEVEMLAGKRLRRADGHAQQSGRAAAR